MVWCGVVWCACDAVVNRMAQNGTGYAVRRDGKGWELGRDAKAYTGVGWVVLRLATDAMRRDGMGWDEIGSGGDSCDSSYPS